MILSGTVSRRVGWPAWGLVCALGLLVLPWSVQSAKADPSSVRALAIAATLTNADAKSIEQRLDRLEKLVEDLADEVRAIRSDQVASASPVVVKTEPANGATDVDPNLKEIRVTFSKDMKNGTWSWTQRSDDTFPAPGDGKIHYEKDKRTCVMPVKLEPGKEYDMSINSQRFQNFKDTAGRAAVPFPFSFKTKGE